jgi:retinol-binding protein 3
MGTHAKGPHFLVVMLAAAVWSTIVFAQVPGGANQPDVLVDARAKSEAIAVLAQDIEKTYVFPDVADKLARMLKERQAHGAYDKIASGKEFAELLTKQMSEIAHDRHLHVIFSSSVLPPTPDPVPGQSPLAPDAQAAQRMQRQQQRTNYGFERLERLRGNVGYLKLNGFADVAQGGDTAAASMEFLANTDALIIDLTDNRGGTPGMVQLLASYFFSGDVPVHLNDLAWRRMGTRAEDLTQWWTLPYVPGKKYLGKEVYILTSHGTFSAGEEFTNDLQALGRATIVGETTGGGANPGGLRRLGDHFGAFIPTGHAINPITKTNWEGKGIEPNLEVPREQALTMAHQTALRHLIDKTQDEHELSELKQALAGLNARPEAQQTP